MVLNEGSKALIVKTTHVIVDGDSTCEEGGRMRLALSVATFLWMSTMAQASLTVGLDHTFSGDSPTSSTTPWLQAVFTDISQSNCGGSNGCVQLDLTAPNLASDGSEFVSFWHFNVLESLSSIAGFSLGITQHSGLVPGSTDGYSNNAYKADGDGYYDFGFNFDTANQGSRFVHGDEAIFYITGVNAAITSASFDATSSPNNASGGGSSPNGTYRSAGHIQFNSLNCSGWIGDSASSTGGSNSGPCGGGGGGASVPEPALYSHVLTVGLLGIGLLVRRRRARS